MPGATTKLALPYPLAADSVDVPRDIKALADKLEPTGAFVTVPAATLSLANTYANRPAAGAVPDGTRFFATDKLMEWVMASGAWVLMNATFRVASSPPTSPIDGQLWEFDASSQTMFGQTQTVSNAGARWRFRYNLSTTYWEWVGGDDIMGDAQGGGNCTANNWSDLNATPAPRYTMPFGYTTADIIASATASCSNVNAGFTKGIAICKNADANPAYLTYGQASVANLWMSLSIVGVRVLGVTPGDDVRIRYFNGGSGSDTFSFRYLRLHPTRIK